MTDFKEAQVAIVMSLETEAGRRCPPEQEKVLSTKENSSSLAITPRKRRKEK